MKPTKRIELLRPRHAQYLSIVDLIAFVTAFAIWFGGMRVAGIYGFTLGCFALQAASGRLLKRNDLPLGALCGSAAMIGALGGAWICFGTLGRAFPDYSEMTRNKLHTVSRWIHEHRDAHGTWPTGMSELAMKTQSRLHGFGWNFDIQRSFAYQRTETGFDLTFLGADDRRGGEGINADVSLEAADTFAEQRIPLTRFLTQTPGTGCMTLTLLLCFGVGVLASVLFHRDSGQLSHDFVAASVLSLGASVAGCLLVGVSLVFWRMV